MISCYVIIGFLCYFLLICSDLQYILYELVKFLVLHGPNLNLLGSREPEVYGHDTLEDINEQLIEWSQAEGHDLKAMQSNAEHELIEHIHRAKAEQVDCIVINPGGLTHTSVALRDAFLSVAIPFVEVHLSNIYARESFRQHSYISDVALAVISGFGAMGYRLALMGAVAKHKLNNA